MSYTPSNLVLHAWRNPPRCIEAFRCAPVEEPASSPYLHDELALFQISCACGNDSLEVYGFADDEAGLLCPLSVRCPTCSDSHGIFDVQLHGYDAEFEHGCCSRRGSGEASALVCGCGASSFYVYPAFAYQIEPVDDLGEEAMSHIEDFFDVFALGVECASCGIRSVKSEYECA